MSAPQPEPVPEPPAPERDDAPPPPASGAPAGAAGQPPAPKKLSRSTPELAKVLLLIFTMMDSNYTTIERLRRAGM